jgi:hypothetical protein
MTEEIKEHNTMTATVAVLPLNVQETQDLIDTIADRVYEKVKTLYKFNCNGASRYEVEDIVQKENSAVRALGIGLGRGLKGDNL